LTNPFIHGILRLDRPREEDGRGKEEKTTLQVISQIPNLSQSDHHIESYKVLKGGDRLEGTHPRPRPYEGAARMEFP